MHLYMEKFDFIKIGILPFQFIIQCGPNGAQHDNRAAPRERPPYVSNSPSLQILPFLLFFFFPQLSDSFCARTWQPLHHHPLFSSIQLPIPESRKFLRNGLPLLQKRLIQILGKYPRMSASWDLLRYGWLLFLRRNFFEMKSEFGQMLT